jgi:AcrR family transcriptional regulator
MRIVDAAKTLQADRGLQATSFEEIAERAGVAQATL